MSQGVHIFRKKDLTSTDWSGGGMTELFIYPPDSRFEERNFILSLVSATIDVEESVFSDLSGYTRLIMTLDNDLELIHDGRKKVNLKKYEPHVFDGGLKTVSRGRVRDFNFVLKTGCGQGESRVVRLTPGASLFAQKRIGPEARYLEFIYAPYASYVLLHSQETELEAGDFLVLDHSLLGSDYRLINHKPGNCDLVICMAALS